MEESLTDIIRTRLDHKQIADVEELLYSLITTVENIEELVNETDILRPDHIRALIAEQLKEYTGELETCHFQTHAATLETPGEWCEEYAVVGSLYCTKHDPED